MKSIILFFILFFLYIGNTYSQSPLEAEFVKQLNVYRKQHGLGPIKYDAEISKVALYHANYLSKCNKTSYVVALDKLPHDEKFDIKDHKELNFTQRASMAPNKNMWSEIQIAYSPIKNIATVSEIVSIMIKSFDGSPKHKEIMLCEDLKDFTNIIGVSIVKAEANNTEYSNYSINVDFGVLIP